MLRRLALCTLALAIACGDDDGDPGTDAGTPDAPGVDAPGVDAPGVDAPGIDAPGLDAGGERVIELIGGAWNMPGGTEGYVCVRLTVEETIFIREFRPIAPLGTHHTVLTYSNTAGSRPDGVSDCNAATNASNMIFGSGVGTEPLTLPDGVAIRLEPGNQLLLNLHLFNTDAAPLEGYSGIEAVLMDEGDVENEAEVLLAGNETFSIPARASDYEVNGGCTMSGSVNVFAVMPHMHQYGVFMEVTANRGGSPTIIHEDFYSFEDQRYRTFDALPMASGDRIDVLCRYDNPTDSSIGWGDSSLQEMCYAAIYRYPRLGTSGITCTR